MSYKKQNYNKRNERYDHDEFSGEDRRTKTDKEIQKLQTTISYMSRDIRDLRDMYNQLRRFSLEQIWFDKDLVERLGKPYLPSPPCMPEAKEEADEQ